MKTQENQFNETKALQVVDEMISIARNRIDENGFLFLLWGWIVFLGNILAYFWQRSEMYGNIGATWAILGTLGGIVTAIYIARKEKAKKVKTYVDRFIAFLWGSFIIALLIFQVFLVRGEHFQLINPIILVITGMATFTTGGALKFKPLIYGGILFWIFGMTTFIITTESQFLISAGAMVLGYLVPGYMLMAKFKKENV